MSILFDSLKAGDGRIAAALMSANNAEELGNLIAKFGRASSRIAGDGDLPSAYLFRLIDRMAGGIIPDATTTAVNTLKQLADDLDDLTGAFSKSDVIRFLDSASRAPHYHYLRGWLYQLTVAAKKARELPAGVQRGIESGKERLDILFGRTAFECKFGLGTAATRDKAIKSAMNQILKYQGSKRADLMYFVVRDESVMRELIAEITQKARTSRKWKEVWNGGNGFVRFEVSPAFYGVPA